MNRVALPLALALCASCGPKAPTTPVAEPEPVAEASPLEAEIASALDREMDPCVDFYAFACGGWEASTEIPADKPRTGRSFDQIADRNLEVLHGLLDGMAADPGDDPVRQKLGAYYASCMDTEAIDAAGIQPIQPTLDQIAAVKDRAGLQALLGELHMEGEDLFFGVWVGADDKNPDLNVLHFAQGGLGLPDRTYYVGEEASRTEKLVGYEAMLAKLFELAGDEAEVAASRAKQAVEVEVALAEASWPVEDLYDPEKTYNKLDKEGLAKAMPNFDVEGFVAASGRPELTQIVVATPSFFESLDGLLKTHDLEALEAYMTATVLRDNASLLSAEFDQTTFGFYGTEMSGQKEQKVRWKRCVRRTDSMLGELLGQAYVDEAFAGDSKEVAVAMIEGIESAFEANLAELEWMDDATRERAVAKARAVRNKIGYPDKWRDYSALEVGDVWFDNYRAARALEIDRVISRAEKPVDKDEWFMSPPTVNAYYNPSGNEIVFPAGILQPPFYSADFPRALNYGAIGMVMGHELTHGFDDSGAKYDPTGKLSDWWEPAAVERFEEAAACVKEQYDKYEVQPGKFINGELTLGENIADMGGIKQAHVAYRAWVAENGEEPELAGFTGDQQVFLAFAQAWCSKATPEFEQMMLARDSHSPARFRVNGALANTPAFHEAFECEVGTPMRPEDTCSVW